jgi:hypothetical protein
MSNWRALADEALGRSDPKNTRDNRNDSPPDVANDASVPTVPPLDPVRALKLWRTELERLDWQQPLHGLGELRWRRLIEDSLWVLDRFGEQAARDGWSARDLFGVLPGHDAWGGVADRLRASRSLMFSGDRAGWRDLITGEPDGFVRGQGDKLTLVPLWEAAG